MSIAPKLTFMYQFAVEFHSSHCWSGPGAGQAFFGNAEGIVGPRPRFELRAGWLTLFPTDGWTQSLPTRVFSDVERSPQGSRRLAAAARRRDLASYALFVGDALGKVLRIGDQLQFYRNGNGDFCYTALRDSDITFSAGSVGRVEHNGPIAVWQECDRHFNPNAAGLKEKYPDMPVAESIEVHRPHVTVRVKDQIFHLLDGEEVRVDKYYVFLARSNQKVPAIAFEFRPRAVHAAGFVGELGKEPIIDAARQLLAPKIKTL